jgi:hypothetical protein
MKNLFAFLFLFALWYQSGGWTKIKWSELGDVAPIQTELYASPAGNDVFVGTASAPKLTVWAALTSLPGGSVTAPVAGGVGASPVVIPARAGSGTVYVAPGTTCNPMLTACVWLMSPNDPNYANPPAGWLQCNGCTVSIIGIPNRGGGPNGHKPLAALAGGDWHDNNHPAIWLSGTQQPMHFSNLGFAYPGRAVVIGECSNGDRSGRCGVSGAVFESVSSLLMQHPNSGPCTDITGGSFWLWFRDYGCGGNAYAAAGGRFANNAAAILIDGTGNSGNGLIHINDSNFAGGGIKFIPGANGGGLYVSNVTEEGLGDGIHDVPPVVWFTGFGGFVDAYLSNIQLADAGPTFTPAVRNDGAGPGPTVTMADSVQGPAVVVNQYNNTFINEVDSPQKQGQVGFFNGYVVGETDVARRVAGLVPVRFKNLAASNPALWKTNNAPTDTITPGAVDPFGGTSAAVTATSLLTPREASLTNTYCGDWYTPTVGDWIVAGAWVKGKTNTPLGILSVGFCGYPGSTIGYQARNRGEMRGDGQWGWQWLALKVSGGTSAPLGYFVQFYSTNPITTYGPVLYVIPAGTLSDNEVLEFAGTMASVDSACPVGSICNMPGHPVVMIK